MRNLLAVSILVGIALMIIAGGIIAVILRQEWIPITYFGIGLALGLLLLTGEIWVEGWLDNDMLWIFPCSMVFGGVFLVIVFSIVMYYAATSSVDSSLCEEDC